MNIEKAQCKALDFLNGEQEAYFIGTHEAFLGTNVDSLIELARAVTYDTPGFNQLDVGADMYCTEIRESLYLCYSDGHTACDPSIQQVFIEYVLEICKEPAYMNFVTVFTA